MVDVAIDTASEVAGVALTEQGALISELTWRTHQNHSRELLPALDWLLQRAALERKAVASLSVCVGPGSYAGLRVGLSTAKALAYGLGARIVGVGRLAADALPFALESGRRVIAVHAAGRAELAFAIYTASDVGLTELNTPALGRLEQLVAAVRPGDIACGSLDPAVIAAIREAGGLWIQAREARVLAVAALGWERLRRHDIDSADSLVPLYLREPAIGPQPAIS